MTRVLLATALLLGSGCGFALDLAAADLNHLPAYEIEAPEDDWVAVEVVLDKFASYEGNRVPSSVVRVRWLATERIPGYEELSGIMTSCDDIWIAAGSRSQRDLQITLAHELAHCYHGYWLSSSYNPVHSWAYDSDHSTNYLWEKMVPGAADALAGHGLLNWSGGQNAAE